MNNLERLPVPRQHPHTEPIAADPDRKSFLFCLFHFIYVGSAGSPCCLWVFSNCGEWGLLFVTLCGLLIAVTSLVEHGLGSCSSVAPQPVESSWARDRTGVPCTGWQNLIC